MISRMTEFQVFTRFVNLYWSDYTGVLRVHPYNAKDIKVAFDDALVAVFIRHNIRLNVFRY